MYTDIIFLDNKTIKLQFDDKGDLVDKEVQLKNYEDADLNGETGGPIE